MWSLRNEDGGVWLEGAAAVDSAFTGTWLVSNTAISESPEALEVEWALGAEERYLDSFCSPEFSNWLRGGGCPE